MATHLITMMHSSRKLSIVFGAASLLSLAPVGWCEDDKKKASDTAKEAQNKLNDILSKANVNNVPKFPFDLKFDENQFKPFQEFLKKELEDGGALQPLRNVFETGLAGQVGYGFLMGYSSGFCLKKVSKLVAFVVGGAFIFVQSLQYGGLIHVNYEGIQKKVEGALDINKDGKVDAKDAEAALEKVQQILSFNMPSGGGFTAGFLMGLRG